MGMLLSMAILLALGSAFLEFKLVKSLKFLDKLNSKSMFFGIMFSIVLSAGLGMVFGAAGLVVMMGGILSSAITEPIWAIRRTMKSKNVQTQARIQQMRQTKNEFVQTYRPVGKAAKFLVVTPFKVAKIPVNVKHGRKIWA